MLPPNSVTIPRTELPMEQLLNIHGPHASSSSSSFNDSNRKVSSPSRTTAEDNAFTEEKERDDHEILRIYDGNSSQRNQIYRTAQIPKMASVEQIRDIAMRRFHINDTPDLYYVTQAPFERKDYTNL